MTKAPVTITYAHLVVSITAKVALMTVALNYFEVKSADILNAYTQAPVTEKVWIMLGPEFDSDVRKTAMIFSSFHGLKSTGAAFRSNLASCMESMGHLPCCANTESWMRSEVHLDYTILQTEYFNAYISLSCLSQGMAIQTCI